MSRLHPLTSYLPAYRPTQLFLRVIVGTPLPQFDSMWKIIRSSRGTPQNPVNWKKPEEWIPQRLSGENQALALRIWRETNQVVNPRYADGIMNLIKMHQLAVGPDDVFTLTETGRKFLDNDEETLVKIDEYEGIQVILSAVAENGPGKKTTFLDSYKDFCLSNTTWRADRSIESSLNDRLRNLLARALIEKYGGFIYQITDSGLAYLQRLSHIPVAEAQVAAPVAAGAAPTTAVSIPELPQPVGKPSLDIARLVKKNNSDVRRQLTEHLGEMDPHMFEHLIKLLLEEMGYEEVAVTSASNDKGVDVVADIELGISRVREVIQVKRQKGNVGRPVLDGLRGSLHRFDAVRATIITTGSYSNGAKDAAFEKGVAPITLIDGERLLDLLIEHNIGVHRREIRIMEFDGRSLSQFDVESESDIAKEMI